MKIDKLTGILIVTIIALVVYIVLSSVNKPVDDKYAKQKQKIDSLTNCIRILDIEHQKQDSLISIYQNELKELEHKVDSTKTKITEIKNYYGKKIKDIRDYTNDDLGDFFAERYK